MSSQLAYVDFLILVWVLRKVYARFEHGWFTTNRLRITVPYPVGDLS